MGSPGGTVTPITIPVEKGVALDLQELKRAGYLAPSPWSREDGR